MATVKFQKAVDGAWNVYLDGEFIGYTQRFGDEWHTRKQGHMSHVEVFGRRSSAAEWLVRQAEREPMHRGGAR